MLSRSQIRATPNRPPAALLRYVSMIGRTSIEPVAAPGTCAAIALASLLSFARIT
jgi:hypothetical protein